MKRSRWVVGLAILISHVGAAPGGVEESLPGDENYDTIPTITTADEDHTTFTFNDSKWRFVFSNCTILDCGGGKEQQDGDRAPIERRWQDDSLQKRDDEPGPEQSASEPQYGPNPPWAMWEEPWEDIIRRYSNEVLQMRPAYYLAVDGEHGAQARLEIFAWNREALQYNKQAVESQAIADAYPIEIHYVISPAVFFWAFYHRLNEDRHRVTTERLERFAQQFRPVINDVHSNFLQADTRIAVLRESYLARGVLLHPLSRVMRSSTREEMDKALDETIKSAAQDFPWHVMTRDEAIAVLNLSREKVKAMDNFEERNVDWDRLSSTSGVDLRDVGMDIRYGQLVAIEALKLAVRDADTPFRPDWRHYYTPQGGREWPRPTFEEWHPNIANGRGDRYPGREVHSVPFTGASESDSPESPIERALDGWLRHSDLPPKDNAANTRALMNWLFYEVDPGQNSQEQSSEQPSSTVSEAPSSKSSPAVSIFTWVSRSGSDNSDSATATGAPTVAPTGSREDGRMRLWNFWRRCGDLWCGRRSSGTD
ncbi:MAG: hypothetical protein M1831_005076 [Alyxoria varia]|nr:MAG: hypothetical protein M1831_005076 [Alyxoria varia]